MRFHSLEIKKESLKINRHKIVNNASQGLASLSIVYIGL
jgi:hypothetical protein